MLMGDGMRKSFLSRSPKNEAKAVRAFVASNSDNALKTKPKVCYNIVVAHSLCASRGRQRGAQFLILAPSRRELPRAGENHVLTNVYMHWTKYQRVRDKDSSARHERQCPLEAACDCATLGHGRAQTLRG